MENFEAKSNVATLTLYSQLLGKEMKINVYTPAGYNTGSNFPVLYFLHGRSGDPNLIFDIGMDRAADQLIGNGEIQPLIMVFPQMDNSHGLNSSPDYREIPDPGDNQRMIHLGMYKDYFLKEIVGAIESRYHTVTERSGRYIGGVSAGGYAALHIAFDNQELFSKVGGHMPALELELEDEDQPYYPTEQVWKEYDPLGIAKNRSLSGLEVYLDCGADDEGEFYKGCALLHETLSVKGVKSQNHVFQGGHNRAYIRGNVTKYLLFYGCKVS